MNDHKSSLDAKTPDILYHYTSQSGLLGIFKEKKIWATNIRYLNDAKEFAYTTDLALDVLRKKKGNIERDLSKMIRSLVKSPEITPVFVVSFSSQKDQLSQWRGYCPETGGFNIGFDSQKLKDLAQEQGFLLSRCIYDSKEQNKIIEKAIDLTCRSMNESDSSQNTASGSDLDSYLKRVSETRLTFALEILLLGPIFKHSSFSQEEEWRLISTPAAIKEMQIKFREGRSMIVPYVEFGLSNHVTGMPIKKIIIGPTPNNQLSKISVQEILAINEVESCQVYCSEVSYRTW